VPVAVPVIEEAVGGAAAGPQPVTPNATTAITTSMGSLRRPGRNSSRIPASTTPVPVRDQEFGGGVVCRAVCRDALLGIGPTTRPAL
jgi:hypothetical protein